jgi:hypothetical protein
LRRVSDSERDREWRKRKGKMLMQVGGERQAPPAFLWSVGPPATPPA